jgi:hypothetical protein
VIPEPFLRDVGGKALDRVDAPPGLGVDEHGRVDAAVAQRVVVDPSRTRGTTSAGSGIFNRTRSMVCREAAARSAGSSRAEARPANSRAIVLTWTVSRVVRRW